jgi:hypothetical protein
MADYYSTGKETILEAAEHQLERIKKAEEISLTNPYGSSHLFEIALKRIGENELANEFIDTQIEDTNSNIVCREASFDSILTSVISYTERNEIEKAKEIEKLHRKTFYVDKVGYLSPVFRGKGPIIWGAIKQKAKQRRPKADMKIMEIIKGLPAWPLEDDMDKCVGEIKDILKRYYPDFDIHDLDRRIRVNFRSLGFLDESLRSLEKSKYLHNIRASPKETIYGVYANLALGKNWRAKKIIYEVVDYLYDEENKMFISTAMYDDLALTANLLRAMDIMGVLKGKRLYKDSRASIMKKFRRALKNLGEVGRSSFERHALSAMAFYLENSGDYENLEKTRKVIADRIIKEKGKRKEDLERYGMTHIVKFGFTPDTFHNYLLIKFGLALTGLEKDKPNRFYAP